MTKILKCEKIFCGYETNISNDHTCPYCHNKMKETDKKELTLKELEVLDLKSREQGVKYKYELDLIRTRKGEKDYCQRCYAPLRGVEKHDCEDFVHKTDLVRYKDIGISPSTKELAEAEKLGVGDMAHLTAEHYEQWKDEVRENLDKNDSPLWRRMVE